MSHEMRSRTPSYRRHKPSDQAVVTLDGTDFYLGGWGSEESKREYDRLISEWLANGRRLPMANGHSGPSCLTVDELLSDYWRFAETYYVKDGQPTASLPALSKLTGLSSGYTGTRGPAISAHWLSRLSVRR